MLAEQIYAGFKFSRVGIQLRKMQKFEPRKNFPLCGNTQISECGNENITNALG